MREIFNFEDFVSNLYEAGMAMGGENGEGIFTLSDYFCDSIHWHTEDVEMDPWEWRIRVLSECQDIAYGKFFFKKSGYITREWYPYFYMVRRRKSELEDEYEEGNVSRYAKSIYEVICEHKELPLHLIKQYGGFSKEDKSKFDSAMTELQMKFYITMCGSSRKVSKSGEEYGWSSMVYCLAEEFFGKEVIKQTENMSYEEAYQKIEAKVYELNPNAKASKVRKFILG